jgi:hypothetical protein
MVRVQGNRLPARGRQRAALVQQAISGDSTALEQIIAVYAARLYRTAFAVSRQFARKTLVSSYLKKFRLVYRFSHIRVEGQLAREILEQDWSSQRDACFTEAQPWQRLSLGIALLAKQVLSQLSYTPTFGVTFILMYFRALRNPFLRFFVITLPKLYQNPRKQGLQAPRQWSFHWLGG